MPKFAPEIVIEVPTAADVGLMVAMLGATAKVRPLLDWPPTVTTTLPVVAPVGTGTPMLVALQLVGVAVVPLKVTVLAPWVAPKFTPAIVTGVPTGPKAGVRLLRLGAVEVTVKSTPVLGTPLTVTTTLPVVAPFGAGTVMLPALQFVGVAAIPLNTTVLVPWLAPKFVPVIVTGVAIGPEVGLRLVIVGVGRTVKLTPLLATPLTVTTTLPVVAALGTGTVMLPALQFVGVAATPLNVTVLVPWLAPKFAPVIVMEPPTGPEAGLRLEIAGVGMTEKVTPLLATPPTVTTTPPEVAPAGTGTAILVALQLVGVAVVPLNFTVLVPWDAPKLEPPIVTDVPTTPEVGVKVAMLGTEPLPLTAARKAAICMIQGWTLSKVAVAL